MSLHEYLMRACQEDAQRAGELDRELRAGRSERGGRVVRHNGGLDING